MELEKNIKIGSLIECISFLNLKKLSFLRLTFQKFLEADQYINSDNLTQTERNILAICISESIQNLLNTKIQNTVNSNCSDMVDYYNFKLKEYNDLLDLIQQKNIPTNNN